MSIENILQQVDDAFWLRNYAGMAMQGMLASGYVLSDDLVIATRAVTQATALLDEIKRREKPESEANNERV
jgi:hypothetical protein